MPDPHHISDCLTSTPGCGQVSSNLNRVGREHVVDEWGGIFDLETLLRTPETLLHIGPCRVGEAKAD